MPKLDFIPTNETQTREWFAAHLDLYGYDIVVSGGAYPDYELRDADGKIYRVEAECESINFIRHRHDPAGCDFVLCWVHNTIDFPLPVLELSTNKMYAPGETNQVAVEKTRQPAPADTLQKKKECAIAEAIRKSDLYNDFVEAFAADLRVQSEWLDAIQDVRLRLLKISRQLCIEVDIDDMHPSDLFELSNR